MARGRSTSDVPGLRHDLTLGPPRGQAAGGPGRARRGPPLASRAYVPALVAALHPTMRRIDSEAHVRVAYARYMPPSRPRLSLVEYQAP